MPEKNYHKNNSGKEMRRLKEFVAEISMRYISHVFIKNAFPAFVHYIPNHTVGCKGKPGLENQRNDASPVKYSAAHRHLHDHIMEPDVVDDEWKGMHERKEEEGIGGPSVEHLEPLMRNSREERDPVRLGRGSAIEC